MSGRVTRHPVDPEMAAHNDGWDEGERQTLHRLELALIEAYAFGDHHDSNHVRWIVTHIAKEMGIKLDVPAIRRPTRKLCAECERPWKRGHECNDDPNYSPEPNTKAGRRLIAEYPANVGDAASPEFIRHQAAAIIEIEAEARELGDVLAEGYWERAYWRIVPMLAEALAKAVEDRDAAIAHDRQPYPTAWAYERACATRDRYKAAADVAEERLTLARGALVATGYFSADQVGPDVAPRIVELWSALRGCDIPRPSDLTNPDAAADYAHGCEECGRPWHEHKPR